MSLNFEKIKQAQSSLTDAIDLYENNTADQKLSLALRDSVIQRFEYTYELSWKLIQRWLSENVSPETVALPFSKKDLFRQAAKAGLVADPVIWFAFHQARNISSLTYSEKEAQEVLASAVAFAHSCAKLITVLESAHD